MRREDTRSMGLSLSRVLRKGRGHDEELGRGAGPMR